MSLGPGDPWWEEESPVCSNSTHFAPGSWTPVRASTLVTADGASAYSDEQEFLSVSLVKMFPVPQNQTQEEPNPLPSIDESQR